MTQSMHSATFGTKDRALADVLIVGGGISGMLSAWYLAREGLSVHLLDQGEPGRESSWAGGGILSPLYPWRYAEAVNRLAGWSQRHYAALVDALREQSGIDAQYLTSGLLMPGIRAGEARLARAWASAHGARLETLEDAAAQRIQPGLRLPEGEHLWMPEVAQVRNPRLLKALRTALERLGVTILTHHRVTGLQVRDGRIEGVEVGAQRIRAGQVVLCAGAWSDQIPGHRPLGIYPVRGQMLLFQAETSLLQHIVLAGDTYLIPRHDGKILAGSTMEYVGFDTSTTEAAGADLHRRASALLPALAGCPIIRHWAGLRPGCDSGIPTIGAHPGIAGLYINAGQFRNGVVLGPASARLLADQILGQTPILAPRDYAMKDETASAPPDR